MRVIHELSDDYKLSDDVKRLAEGVRDHLRFNWSEVEDREISDQLTLDRAYLALSSLSAVERLDVNVHRQEGDTLFINHVPFVRSVLFLYACGFSTETITRVGVELEHPFGSI